jgi:hypothetical protein
MAAALATPKSKILATPSSPTSTFCGETSRCTMCIGSSCSFLASCVACRPCNIPESTLAAISTGMRSPFFRALRTSLASDSPATYSMTRKTSPSVVATSSVLITLGCWMREARRASSRNISTNSGSLPN